MRLPARFAILLLLPLQASAYELVIDGRSYQIAGTAEHTFSTENGLITLLDAELSSCRRYRDGGPPSMSGATRLRYGTQGRELSSNAIVELRVAPFRYVVNTVDGDIVCLPNLPSPIFGNGYE